VAHSATGAGVLAYIRLATSMSLSTPSNPPSADRAWAQAPPELEIAANALHVWRADLLAVEEELLGSLSAAELERAGRILSARERRLWRGARAILRALLGRYVACDPGSLRFGSGPYGKPSLLGAPAELRFNVSHSGALALYAFSASGAVGVDVEVSRRRSDVLRVAARVLGAGEARRIGELDESRREHEFLRAWVRHEARLKCAGTGIGNRARIGAEPWIAELEPAPGAAAAVAAAHPVSELRCWDWRR
jgi:4'-phosphopantetheinyl transferase